MYLPLHILIATKQAEKAYGYKYRHGCVIFNGRKIVSKGCNKQRHTPELYKYGYKRCWLHAESDAIIKGNPFDMMDAELLVVRLGKTKLSNSKPCAACMSMIREAGIEKVFYTDATGSFQMIEVW